jgi:hypothetical protein
MPLRPVDIPPAFALRPGGDQNASDQRELNFSETGSALERIVKR